MRPRPWLIALAALLALSACGLKGDLYLPAQPEAAAPVAPADPVADEEDDDEKS